MGDLENVLPDEIVKSTLWPGNELVLPFAEASRAVGIATEHQIAVLGFEAFDVKKDGLYTVDLSDASSFIHFTGDWLAYVVALNTEADHWIIEHRYGTNHGYILTSASKSEFDYLQEPRKTNRL
jgi:hypothetical protein